MGARAEQDLLRTVPFQYVSGPSGSMAARDTLKHVVQHATHHHGRTNGMLHQTAAHRPDADICIVIEAHQPTPNAG